MDRLRQLEADIKTDREVLASMTGKVSMTDTERDKAAQLTEGIARAEAALKLERQQLEYDRNEAPAIAWPESHTPAAVLRQRVSGPGAAGRRYCDLFGQPSPSAFTTHEEFFVALHGLATRGVTDPRLLTPTAAMNEAVGSAGGFAVPAPLAAQWLDSGLESEAIRPRATVFAMTSDTLGVPAWSDYDHSGGSIAGFRATWTAELGTMTDTQGTLRKVTLAAQKLLVSTQLSNELLADGGQSFQVQLEEKMGAAVSWSLDSAFFSGTGVGMPLGLLADPALITVAAEAGQVADTFVLENALKMYSRMWGGGFENAVWLVNASVIPQLYALHLKIKNVAGSENVGGSLTSYFTVGADGQMRLLGLPIIVSEKCSAIGDVGDVILADLTQYLVGLRQDVVLESSRHAGWSTDSSYFRAVIRATGQGSWLKPLTPKAGSTQSWVITLAAR